MIGVDVVCPVLTSEHPHRFHPPLRAEFASTEFDPPVGGHDKRLGLPGGKEVVEHASDRQEGLEEGECHEVVPGHRQHQDRREEEGGSAHVEAARERLGRADVEGPVDLDDLVPGSGVVQVWDLHGFL